MSEDWKSGTSSWRARCGIAAAVIVLSLHAARAENTLDIAPDPDQSRAEYEQVSKEITLSSERLAKLAADIATVKKDHASITAALIQSAMTEQKLGQDIEDIGARLEGLKGQEQKIRASLMARRDVLAEVLGALQRMGLNPPPAILVKPEDALSSVRSAILLGAVVPELRQQTDKLLADLKEQSRVTASIEAERARLTAAVGDQTAEKKRLGMLLEAKQKLEADTQDGDGRRKAAIRGAGGQGRQPEGTDRVARSRQEPQGGGCGQGCRAKDGRRRQDTARRGANGTGVAAGAGRQPTHRRSAVFGASGADRAAGHRPDQTAIRGR